MAALSPILVADDDSDAVFLLRRLLQQAGVRRPIIGVADGQELLEFLQSATFGGLIPSVLFLDINMPRMSGFDALEFIRGQPQLKQLRVFMLTHSDLEIDRARASNLGADGYLLKFPAVEELRVLCGEPPAVASA